MFHKDQRFMNNPSRYLDIRIQRFWYNAKYTIHKKLQESINVIMYFPMKHFVYQIT